MKKLCGNLLTWLQSQARKLLAALAPKPDISVATGFAVDAVRTRRELIFENAMLRQQIIILRRKSRHPKITPLDRIGTSPRRRSVTHVAAGPDHRATGDVAAMASRRIPLVLATAVKRRERQCAVG